MRLCIGPVGGSPSQRSVGGGKTALRLLSVAVLKRKHRRRTFRQLKTC